MTHNTSPIDLLVNSFQEVWYAPYLQKSSSKDILLIDERSLPMQECKHLDRIRLVYLTTIQAPSNKTPLTDEAEEACIASQRYRKNVKWSIIAGLGATTILFAPLNYLALQNNVIAASTAMMIQTIVSSAVSYYATGIAPYMASNRDNETQNAVQCVTNIYDNLGAKLLKLYYHNPTDRKFAQEIANRLDLNEISREICAKTQSQSLTDVILSRLTAATLLIRDGSKASLKKSLLFYEFAKGLKKKYNKKHR